MKWFDDSKSEYIRGLYHNLNTWNWMILLEIFSVRRKWYIYLKGKGILRKPVKYLGSFISNIKHEIILEVYVEVFSENSTNIKSQQSLNSINVLPGCKNLLRRNLFLEKSPSKIFLVLNLYQCNHERMNH